MIWTRPLPHDVRSELRLRRKGDFLRLRRSSQSFRGVFCRLVCAPNQLPHNRYAVVASKRLGGAVIRNRVRRRYREILRQVDGELRQGQDLMFIANLRSVEASYGELRAACHKLLQRAALFAPGSPGPGVGQC